MSAHKHKGNVGGRQQPMNEEEKYESYVWCLSRDVSKACDNYQMRVNGYKYQGLRGIIKADVLDKQSRNR